jgi:CO dehydrogenase maturation factor
MFKLNPKVDDLVEKFGIVGEDGVKLLVLGTISQGGGGCFCPENALLKALIKHLLLKEEILIMDMEAGVEHLGRGTAKNVDVLIIVVEPGMRSVETAGRIKSLAEDIEIQKVVAVLNKATVEREKELIEGELKKLEIPLVGVIPYSKGVIEADLRGISPLDVEENQGMVAALSKLKDYLAS